MDATEAVKGGKGRGGVGLGGDAHGFWRLKVAWVWVGDTESLSGPTVQGATRKGRQLKAGPCQWQWIGQHASARKA